MSIKDKALDAYTEAEKERQIANQRRMDAYWEAIDDAYWEWCGERGIVDDPYPMAESTPDTWEQTQATIHIDDMLYLRLELDRTVEDVEGVGERIEVTVKSAQLLGRVRNTSKLGWEWKLLGAVDSLDDIGRTLTKCGDRIWEPDPLEETA